jgi:putative SOS response-associated peptidase YedK
MHNLTAEMRRAICLMKEWIQWRVIGEIKNPHWWIDPEEVDPILSGDHAWRIIFI